MGREVRRVPPNWHHPQTSKYGREECYQPMHDETYEHAANEWLKEFHDFMADPKAQAEALSAECKYFWDWHGSPPTQEYYRPYSDEEATWFQVYETVSEGTPVTPAFATKEELVEYLVANGDAWDQKRGDGPWTRKSATAFVMGDGWDRR